jgi:hypothetical protein
VAVRGFVIVSVVIMSVVIAFASVFLTIVLMIFSITVFMSVVLTDQTFDSNFLGGNGTAGHILNRYFVTIGAQRDSGTLVPPFLNRQTSCNQ